MYKLLTIIKKMKIDRINELKDFSNDFFKWLGEDENEDENKTINRPIKTQLNEDIKSKSNKILLNMPNFSITQLYNKRNNKKISVVKINYK